MFEGSDGRRFDAGFFGVLHQMCKILLTNSKHVRLREYVIGQTNAPDIPLSKGRISFEELPLQERHHVIQLGMWVIAEPRKRIGDAWQTKSVRYNVLKKDFSKMPLWYRETVNDCADWRSNILNGRLMSSKCCSTSQSSDLPT